MRLLYRETSKLAGLKRSRLDETGKLCFTRNDDLSKPYAILSHTWGDDEVTYQEVLEGKSSRKLDFALAQAERDGHEYVWIDTCCIDKRDRNELGKAINLMWEWYKESAVCYVYLSDVPRKQLAHSRWFTRGWTLQELVAPASVKFFDSDGVFLGDGQSLSQNVFAATGIDVQASIERVPLAERWQWAQKRSTTEPEDMAYCMLGLLGITIISNYGEGADRAKERLLEAVKKEHGERVLRDMQRNVSDSPCHSVPAMKAALRFDGMMLRRQAIDKPFEGTCLWLKERFEFKQWQRRERKLLWLRGHPGAGKSTLMKAMQDGIAYYFNARGPYLEQSTVGMYRSLLYQLLDTFENEIGGSVLLLVKKQIEDGLKWQSLMSLRDTLSYALQQCPVSCYIDALDECDEREVQEMVHFIETAPHVLFASRYYPTVAIDALELDMRSNDLALFVRATLRAPGEERVIAKANGIFFWAVLVVKLLNSDYSKGILRDVDELPGKLDELLQSIVFQDDNLERFKLVMALLLFSNTETSKNLTSDDFCNIISFPFGGRVVSQQRFIADCSRGLAEVIENKRVQYIHETVREYVLKSMHHLCGQEPANWAHDTLKRVYLRYIPRLSDISLLDQHMLNLMYHADRASSQEQFLRSEELAKLCAKQLGSPSILMSIVRSNGGNLIRTAYERNLYDSDALCSVLKHAVHSQQRASFTALLQCGVDVARRFEDGGPLHWALQVEHETDDSYTETIVSEFIQHGADVEAVDRDGYTPLLSAVYINYKVASLLARGGANVQADCKGTTALHLIVQRPQGGDAFDLLNLLIERGAIVDAQDSQDNTPLHLACRSGMIDGIIGLLQVDACQNKVNKVGMTPAELALIYTDKQTALKVFRLLHEGDVVQFEALRKRTWLLYGSAVSDLARKHEVHHAFAAPDLEYSEDWWKPLADYWWVQCSRMALLHYPNTDNNDVRLLQALAASDSMDLRFERYRWWHNVSSQASQALGAFWDSVEYLAYVGS